MKKQSLQYFILLMGFALVGLVALQIYWVNVAWQVNQERFKQGVHDALNEVAHKLEQKEILYLTQQQDQEPLTLDEILQISLDSQTLSPSVVENISPPKKELNPDINAYQSLLHFNFPQQSISIARSFQEPSHFLMYQDSFQRKKLFEMQFSEKSNFYKTDASFMEFKIYPFATDLSNKVNQIINFSHLQSIQIQDNQVQMNYNKLNEKTSSVQNRIVSQKDASDIQQISPNKLDYEYYKANGLQVPDKNIVRITTKSDLITHLVEQIKEKSQDIENRIDPKVLDSLLKAELSNRGITVPYQFTVEIRPRRDDQAEYLFVKHEEQKHEILENGYPVRLFPTEWFGSPAWLYVHFPNPQSFILKNTAWVLGSSLLFIGLIVFCFATAIFIILKQKKLSEITHDFINNMTHELKTPISTVSLACEAIQDPDIRLMPTQVDRYLKIIQEENDRLGHQVEKVLQIAVLDRGDFQLKIEHVDIHQIIDRAIHHISIQVENRQGTITTNLRASPSEVKADEGHLLNIILNLLDNANKYSPQLPQIRVQTYQDAKGVFIEIQDKGCGMNRETIKKVFDKFYRVPTGNLHDVKGFGLGLSYVKSMTEAHSGEIFVKSELNKGSTFTLFFPFEKTVP